MTTARSVALAALARIDDGAYANLVLPPMLARSGLDERDRRFATDLVYGTTRMQRACDFLVDRFLLRPDVEPEVRYALRLGAYQLHYLRTPAHAAVAATVGEVKRKARGIVNAVLRKVADAPVAWPDDATRLSYPDWIVDRLVADLGQDDALGALAAMNDAAVVHERADGYVQDPASQEVARYVASDAGALVLDACAAPGGKATLIAEESPGSFVVANDVGRGRTALVVENVASTGTAGRVVVQTSDARRLPHRAGQFDTVLVDAPCSGLGVLRRRPDARWRIAPSDLETLTTLQREILTDAVRCLRPGGRLAYSVCTLTAAETVEIDEWMQQTFPTLAAQAPPPAPWTPLGRGGRLLPQATGTDGMYLLTLRESTLTGR